jgi:hypothetical protein
LCLTVKRLRWSKFIIILSNPCYFRVMINENNEFNKWNKIKQRVHVSEKRVFFPHESEVWMCTFGKNIGYEQNGSGENFSRPVLIVKKFNSHMFWVAPLSTKQKNLDFYFNFTDPERNEVSVILAQLRLISAKRLSRKMYELDPSYFRSVKGILRGFLK